MSEAARITAFEKALRTAFTQFKAEEEVIRAKHAAAVQSGSLRVPLDDDALLERPTRRFLTLLRQFITQSEKLALLRRID